MPKKPQDFLSGIHEQVSQFLPDVARLAKDDLEQHARAAVLSVTARLDLVTRDEFDAQVAVLQRTRQKVDALEARVAELEARLAEQSS